jgi:hypothetical protein
VVEKATVSEADALARKHPIAAFSLDALTSGAAKLRPQRVALAEAGPGDPTQSLTYSGFDAQVAAVAQHLQLLGLAPGERILILTGPRSACVVTTLAALAAGLEPLLVRIGFDGPQLAGIAALAGCAAIAGPTSYGEFNLEETLLEAAARSETIRIVATLGPGEVDGALDFAPERLPRDTEKPLLTTADVRPRIGTLSPRKEPIFHEQSALLAAALDLVGKAEIAAGSRLLSTLAPASFASLVAGPVASLLSGAPLTLFGPFEAANFVAILDGGGPNHCIVPAAILPDMAQAGLLHGDVFASVVAVGRDEFPVTSEADCRLIEVRALEEGSLTIRRARAESKAAPILLGEVLAPVFPARHVETNRR